MLDEQTVNYLDALQLLDRIGKCYRTMLESLPAVDREAGYRVTGRIEAKPLMKEIVVIEEILLDMRRLLPRIDPAYFRITSLNQDLSGLVELAGQPPLENNLLVLPIQPPQQEPCECGKPGTHTEHRGFNQATGTQHIVWKCCDCHVNEGHAPLDWHAGCRAAYRRLEVRLERQSRYEPGCECAWDARGLKVSRYCPVHDVCETCEERMGVMKDPTFDPQTEARPYWICGECAAEAREAVAEGETESHG
jgi:hypothetical protein